jgi:ribosomal protein L11 methyltransferase
MPWLAVSIIVKTQGVEPISDALMSAGALSIDVSDADAGTPYERPIFDEPDGTRDPGWLRARVCALFAIDVDLVRALTEVLTEVGMAPDTAYTVSRVDDDDWVRRTQAQFTPQHVTSRLWIVPSWHEPPDPHALNVVLDPGLAFGTGTHPTTRLCLRWLDTTVRGGEAVIDFGCGSGILAIAALKLGASSAIGIDIDPQAVLAARRNAEQNRVSATFVSAAEQISGPAPILVANILAQPLIVLAPLLAELTASGGKLALSGILEEQANEVEQTYRAWYDLRPAESEAGWVLLAGVRR